VEMRASYDVVIVGSGFGGAVTACRLAQAGHSVCVLERGKRWGKVDFPRSPGEVSKAFWIQNESHGFLEYSAFRRIDVLRGCGVGGGSLHYFNVHLRCPPEIFASAAWPTQVTRATLDPYYDLAEGMLDSAPLTPPPGRELPDRTTAFLAAASAVGRRPQLVPIGVYTGDQRTNPHSGLAQAGCDYSGNCLLGCSLHAKNSLDLNYLPLAEKHGAEVYALHSASKIEPSRDCGYTVFFERLDPARPGRSEPGSVTARQVVLAAGTLGTNELLLRCKQLYGTLPDISAALGTRFSGNGDFLLAGTLNADREIDPSRGPSITAGADFSTKNNRIFVEDLGYPDPFIWLLEGAAPNSSRVFSVLTAAKSYLLATFGRSDRMSFEADRLFRGGTTTHFMPYLGMGTDAANGRLTLRGRCIDIAWSHRKSRRMFRELESALKELSGSLHGRYITSILWRWPFRKLLTAHPLGGCFMGEHKEESVANHRGQVWGYPNLFVADASLIPSALSVNPSLTISALAERVAFWMVHGREMQSSDTCAPRNN
jgi:cholesterol oxidase